MRMRKKGANSLVGSIVAGQEEIVSNKKRGDYFGYKKHAFYNKCNEILEQIAQTDGGCFIHGDIQGQDGPGTGQSDIA